LFQDLKLVFTCISIHSSAIFVGDVDMVRAMDEEGRAKLADMELLAGCGLLEMASCVPRMKVCKYLVEELGFDVDLGGFRGGAHFSSSRLTAFLFLLVCFYGLCYTVM
jgi:hypothetical protein